jgi:hypothetical protein
MILAIVKFSSPTLIFLFARKIKHNCSEQGSAEKESRKIYFFEKSHDFYHNSDSSEFEHHWFRQGRTGHCGNAAIATRLFFLKMRSFF